MEDGQKDGRGREVRLGTGVAQIGGEAPEIEDLAEVAGEGRQAVSGPILPSHHCKIETPTTRVPSARCILYAPFRLRARRAFCSRRNSSRLISEILSRSSFSRWKFSIHRRTCSI